MLWGWGMGAQWQGTQDRVSELPDLAEAAGLACRVRV